MPAKKWRYDLQKKHLGSQELMEVHEPQLLVPKVECPRLLTIHLRSVPMVIPKVYDPDG
jgi:hypothetical protein